jgi:PPOX class probable F420-dependent enzyme
VALRPGGLAPEVLSFLDERIVGTLTTLRADGSPHVTAVGFTYDDGARLVRIITWAASVKARNAARGGRAVVAQVEGRRWLALEGEARLVTAADGVAAAVAAYAGRYRQPGERPDRVAIEIAVDRILGRA